MFLFYFCLKIPFYQNPFLLLKKSKKLKIRNNFFTSVFAFSFFYSPILLSENNPYRVQNQIESPSYTCQINQECLDYLHNDLLNKESLDSIYQICRNSHQIIKNCCANPMSCSESYAENITQDLNNNILNLVQQTGANPLSCHLNNLSSLISFLASSQKLCL